MNISGETILITGGTSGIGKALAELLKSKNEVIVTGRSAKGLKEAREAGMRAIACDLTQRADMDRLVVTLEQEYPNLSVLINNAGIQYNYLFTEVADARQRIEDEIAINLVGTIQLTQLLLPLLRNHKSTILNVTSALGAVPKKDGLVYSASKAGLRNFHRGLRKSLRDTNVKAIEILPPVTDTKMTAGRNEKKVLPHDLAKLIVRQWKGRKRTIAPRKIKLLLVINSLFSGLADRIIS